MVREIVHLQVGQCGNQVGNVMWQSFASEHCLTHATGQFNDKDASICDTDGDGNIDQLEKVSVYFRNTDEDLKKCKHIPRAILIDLEPGTVDVIKASPIGGIFKPDNMIFGANGAGNNWAKGHYTEGAELVDNVMDITRKEVEQCDCPQGFQIVHSLGGGTGSGMGTLLLLKIRDTYPDRITTTYSIYPSPKVSDTVVEPYNGILSTHQLLENSDETFIVDNEALYNISHNVLKMKQPTYKQLNGLIAQVACGITASIRFPGKLNGDLRKLGVNLVPFPRLHFFLVSQAPLFEASQSERVKLTVQELTTQCWSARNFYSNVKAEDGKYLAVALTYRGAMTTSEVDENVRKLNETNTDSFVQWIPNNVKSGVVEIPPLSSKMSATCVSNTTALKGIFQRLATQFGAMYKRKAFLHWYKNEGMDEMEFQEADKNVRDLNTEYLDKEMATMGEDE